MNDEDIQEGLVQLVSSKDIKVSMKNNEEYYKFTKKGLKNTETMLKKNEEHQLCLFTLFFKILDKKKSKEEICADAINMIEKSINPNFRHVLYKAVKEGRIKGISLKKKCGGN